MVDKKRADNQKLDNDREEKSAMRGFLQRAEVRLSTMHRVAGAFLGGAGLLFLFPVFLRDAFIQLLGKILEISDSLSQILLLLCLLVTLGLPLWSLYLLIKDIVFFYFTAYHAGIKETYFHPRFVLTGITFSEDESPTMKQEIINNQHRKDMRRFLIPRNNKDQQYYLDILKDTNYQVIPETRKQQIPLNTDVETKNDIELFYTAFGLAGVLDRTLSEEVAKMEMSLAKHALNLRHLVLRYMKALLVFLLTTIILIISNELSRITPSQSKFWISSGFALWAFLLPFVVTRPIRWISSLTSDNLFHIRSDRQLVMFERVVVVLSLFVLPVALYNTIFPEEISQKWQSIIYIIIWILLVVYWFGNLFSLKRLFFTEKPKNSENKILVYDYDVDGLIKTINKKMDENELNIICNNLGIDYDVFPGDGKNEKAQNIIGYLKRRNRLHEFISELNSEYPNNKWNTFLIGKV